MRCDDHISNYTVDKYNSKIYFALAILRCFQAKFQRVGKQNSELIQPTKVRISFGKSGAMKIGEPVLSVSGA
jgi:hypothetical protein